MIDRWNTKRNLFKQEELTDWQISHTISSSYSIPRPSSVFFFVSMFSWHCASSASITLSIVHSTICISPEQYYSDYLRNYFRESFYISVVTELSYGWKAHGLDQAIFNKLFTFPLSTTDKNPADPKKLSSNLLTFFYK